MVNLRIAQFPESVVDVATVILCVWATVSQARRVPGLETAVNGVKKQQARAGEWGCGVSEAASGARVGVAAQGSVC
jgi:hypothetical protein